MNYSGLPKFDSLTQAPMNRAARLARAEEHGGEGGDTGGHVIPIQGRGARQDPESLVGHCIDVAGRGVGTVTGVKKARGRSTQHLVVFGDGAAPELVLLQKLGREGKGLAFHLLGDAEGATTGQAEEELSPTTELAGSKSIGGGGDDGACPHCGEKLRFRQGVALACFSCKR